MTKLPIYQVDAFAGERFKGNPAAVVPLEEWLPDALLQNIAAENNLSETAFFIPSAGKAPSGDKTHGEGADFRLRWFTPTVEVSLCGHATLATGHVIRHHHPFEGGHVTFASRSGMLQVRFGEESLILDFPSIPAEEARFDLADFEPILGVRPIEVFESGLGDRDPANLMAVLADEASIRDLRPDLSRLATYGEGCLIVTARGDEVDFVSRFFGPGVGIDEDPVTGSVHCMMGPFWGERLAKTKLAARQLSKRGGELAIELVGDRVHIGGRAVTYLEGTIEI